MPVDRPGLLALLALSCALPPGSGAGPSEVSPGTEAVTLTAAFVPNQERCRRLCWYRGSQCRRFWYRKDYTLGPGGKDNCVLHASTAVPVQSYPDWTAQDVSDSDSPVRNEMLFYMN